MSVLVMPGEEIMPSGNFIQMQGQLVQGGLMELQLPVNTQVTLDGKRVSGWGNTYYIGFGRDNQPISRLSITYPDGENEQYDLPIQQQQYEIQRINKVSNSIVNPNPKNAARNKKEIVDIVEARLNADYQCAGPRNFIRPTPGIVTGWFGSQRVYNGVPAAPHSGVDFAGPIGTPVVAPESGKVIYTQDMFVTGKTMSIDHGCGLISTFLHLSEFDKEVGDEVQQGEVVAKIGKTGLATGPHLHWNIHQGSTKLDALLVLRLREQAAPTGEAYYIPHQ